MTAAKFYEALAEAGKRMKWTVNEDGAIRGRFKRAKVKRDFCPITAVTYLKTRKYMDIDDIDSKYLGLNDDFCSKVTYASDNGAWSSPKVRRRLRQTLGV